MPAKKDPYSTHGMKIISLFARLLFSGQPHSLIGLSQFLRCSKQTVIKLIDEIRRSYGVDIEESIKNRKRYYQLRRPGKIKPALHFTDKEITTMLMCKAFTEHLLGREQIRLANQAIDKSMGLVDTDQPASLKHFGFFPYGRIDYTPHQQVISDIIQAIENRRICEIHYKRIMAKRSKLFYIKPFKIFTYRDTLYLNAKMARKPGKPWTEPDFDPLLAVHRITKLKVTGRKFEAPRNYDFNKAFEQDFGIIKDDPFEADIEFSGWAADYVQDRKWSKDQKTKKLSGGSIRITFTTSSAPEVVSWVLSFGDEAEVKGPDWLIKDILEHINNMRTGYGL